MYNISLILSEIHYARNPLKGCPAAAPSAL